jgi:hypothetical protein
MWLFFTSHHHNYLSDIYLAKIPVCLFNLMKMKTKIIGNDVYGTCDYVLWQNKEKCTCIQHKFLFAYVVFTKILFRIKQLHYSTMWLGSYLCCVHESSSARKAEISVIFPQFVVHWHSDLNILCSDAIADKQLYLQKMHTSPVSLFFKVYHLITKTKISILTLECKNK